MPAVIASGFQESVPAWYTEPVGAYGGRRDLMEKMAPAG